MLPGAVRSEPVRDRRLIAWNRVITHPLLDLFSLARASRERIIYFLLFSFLFLFLLTTVSFLVSASTNFSCNFWIPGIGKNYWCNEDTDIYLSFVWLSGENHSHWRRNVWSSYGLPSLDFARLHADSIR